MLEIAHSGVCHSLVIFDTNMKTEFKVTLIEVSRRILQTTVIIKAGDKLACQSPPCSGQAIKGTFCIDAKMTY